MEESFLHFVWKYKLFNQNEIKTTDGEPLRILNPGLHNHDAGPDFANAKIKIGNTIWAGNVEVHLRSSDWEKHNHSDDEAYQNVILHVVYEHDKQIQRKNGEIIPAFRLRFDNSIFEKYTYLQIAKESIACSTYLQHIDHFFINNWVDRLGVERLERKASEIGQRWKRNNRDIEQSFYEQLAISFGLKTNTAPFEQLSRNLPLKTLMHHGDSLFQIESLLFGVSGFLDEVSGNNDYQKKLYSEYKHLSNKYQLNQVNKHQWKFMRMRPSNFPTIRIAQFASVIADYEALFSKIIAPGGSTLFEKHFRKTTSDFWDTHYTFEKKSPMRKKKVGDLTIKNIVINAIAPFLFFYGNTKKQQAYKDNAIKLLQDTKLESNKITTLWGKAGLKPKNAFESQALIQLFNVYCSPRKCLDCQIGSYILSKLNTQP